MNKYLFTLLFVLAGQLACAQSIDRLFEEFGSERHAENVRMSPFLMGVVKLFASHHESESPMRSIKSMRMLDLEACATNVKERFHQQAKRLDLDGYDELVRVNDSGERVSILAKRKKDIVREVLVVCSGNGTGTLVQIKGKFSKDDLDKLVSQETTKKHGRR